MFISELVVPYGDIRIAEKVMNSRNQSPRSFAKLLPSDQSPDTLSTDTLIDRFDKVSFREHVDAQENPFLDSTTGLIDADLDNLRGNNRRRDVERTNNVSESTVEIKDNHLITPLKRPVSGSSLITDSSPEVIPSESNRRSTSLPPEQLEDQYLDLEYFSLLLDQLPDTERYTNFKGILEHYVRILDEHDMNIANDAFIITIHNQLKNHQVRNKLEKIIDIFLNKPSNFALKLSNFLYFKDLALRRKLFRIWLIKRRIQYELNQSWKIWKIYLKKKYLSQWIYKHKIITEDFQSNAIIFNDVKTTMKTWDIWREIFQQQKSLQGVADLQLESKFFANWNARVELDNDKADTFYQNFLQRRTLKSIKLNSLYSNNNIKLKVYFHKWRKRQIEIKSIENDGLELEKTFHAGFFFSKWSAKSGKTLSKTQKLEQIYNNSITEKYFAKWGESMYYKAIENQVITKREEILKDYTIRIWKQRLQHINMLEGYNKSQGKLTQSKFLNIWKRQLTLKQTASEAGDHTILKTYMKIWKLSTNRRIYQSTKNYQLAKSNLGIWNNKTKLKELEKKYNIQLVGKYWDKLIVKKLKNENALEAGMEAYESYTKVIYFNHWRGQLDQVYHNEDKADKFLQRIFYEKIQNKRKNLNSLEQKAIDFETNKISKGLLKRFFNKWVDKHENLIEKKLEGQLSKFNKKCQSLQKSAVLKNWQNQYNSYLSQEQLFKEEFLSGLYLKPTFEKWISKYNKIKEMEIQADEINNLDLLSTGFTKFQLAYLKIEELEIKLLEFEDDSNVKLILKFLNIWSLKLLKVKRDDENISSFQKRWNRAHCRAILLLWKGKVLDRKSNDSIDEINDDDESPTKFKSLFHSVLPTETPRKSIFDTNFSNSPFKNSSISIPGSERIKRKRYEALKSHYSQIKYALPSPLKSQINKNGSKKLNFNQPSNRFLFKKSSELKLQSPSTEVDLFDADDTFGSDI